MVEIVWQNRSYFTITITISIIKNICQNIVLDDHNLVSQLEWTRRHAVQLHKINIRNQDQKIKDYSKALRQLEKLQG